MGVGCGEMDAIQPKTNTDAERQRPPARAALEIVGMDCASCVAHVENAARKVKGVLGCRTSLARGRAIVQYDPALTSPSQVAKAITAAGYKTLEEKEAGEQGEEARMLRRRKEARVWLGRAARGITLWLPLEIIHWILRARGGHGGHEAMNWVALGTSTMAMVLVAWGFYASAFKALRRGTSNMDTLIAMGAGVAYGYSLTAFMGYIMGWWQELPEVYFMEATGLLAIISTGHWLESRARDAAGSAIHGLLQLAPTSALRLDAAGQGQPVALADLEIGDRVLVRPGDRVPIDGVVMEGASQVDESMITGEGMPAQRTRGDQVIGGTQNHDGRLIIRATKVGSQTALAQIVELVETAQSSKPPVQRLADRIAAVFVPAVLAVALLTGAGWYFYGRGAGWDAARVWGTLAQNVCSVLIIACPCALGLALPAAIMVGTGRGARRGILIRDLDALQKAQHVKVVVLDKTGTITRGKPAVARIVPTAAIGADEMLRLAASVEQYSEHPLAKAIVNAAEARGLELASPESFHSEAGMGVAAEIMGATIWVGQVVAAAPPPPPSLETPEPKDSGETVVHVTRQSAQGIEMLGKIMLADELKEDSAAAIRQLHEMGLQTVLLTGDQARAANAVARMVGIEQVVAGVKPAQKAALIARLQAGMDAAPAARATGSGGTGAKPPRSKTVAMVGDGINDAPALAQADLGIAVGSGSDIAKETGSIVLVSNSLMGVAVAIRLSWATMRIIKQNLFLAFIYNVLAIPLAAMGCLNPLLAAAAMGLSDICVIGNSLRLRWVRVD